MRLYKVLLSSAAKFNYTIVDSCFTM